jgi:ATP-dependent Lon protease
VFIPKENEKDVSLLPAEVRQTLEIKFVERVEDVLADAIIGSN